MYEELLKRYSDQIDNLDTDSLFNYLIQNGVLETTEAETIRKEGESEEVNKALMRHMDGLNFTGSSNPHILFVNGLRNTGHHQLANILDKGHRIHPRRWNSLGYLNRSRHKGQVCMVLQVNAVGLPAFQGLKLTKGGICYWISLDELRLEDYVTHMQISTSSQALHRVQVQVIDSDDERCCGCICFGRKKKNAQKQQSNDANGNNPNPSDPKFIHYKQEPGGRSSVYIQDTSVDNDSTHPKSACVPWTEDWLDEIQAKTEVMQEKSQLFYEHLKEGGKLRNQLLAYFEQKRSVLVLDTMFETEGVIVVCIATKTMDLQKLEDDFKNGQLVRELEDKLITEELLHQLGLQALRLQLSVEEEEFSKAIQDLEEG